MSVITVLLKAGDKLPPSVFYFLAGVSGALILVYLMKLMYAARNSPLESIGKIVPDILTLDIAKSISFPNISVDIKEVYLRPFQNKADCFMHVIVHNASQEAPTSMQDYYKVFITISEKQYEGFYANLAGYRGTDRKNPDMKQIPLVSLRKKLSRSSLVAGKHEDGWLRFRFDGLPDWPEGEPYISGMIEDINEETQDTEEKFIYEKPYLTTTATSIKLVLKDSYGIERPKEVNLPCWEQSKFIRKLGQVKASLD